MTELLRPLVLTVTLLGPAPASAMTVDEALRRSMTHPSLCEATHRVARADARVVAEEEARPMTLGADAVARHERGPTLAVGGVTTPTTDVVALGADLDKTLAWGTRLEARVEAGYRRSAIPVAPGASQQLELGPGMSVSARVGFEQPLLKGAGTGVGQAELRARHYEVSASKRTRAERRRAVLRDVLNGYYELWYAQEALAIERKALRLARAELSAVREQVEAGTSARAEVTTVVARVAERREAVAAAALVRQQRSIELALRMGVGPQGAARFVATEAPPAPPLMGRRSAKSAIRRSFGRSHELAALEAERKAARERLALAGDTGRPRLDLTGWVQTQGLGYRRADRALSQLGTFGAVSAQVGLRFEAPVSGVRRNAETAAARAEVARLAARTRTVRHQLSSEVRELVARAATARRRLRLSRKTIAAARAELSATRARHREGEVIALDVARAIEALRRAELRQRRWQAQWAMADVALRSHTGERLTGKRLPPVRCDG